MIDNNTKDRFSDPVKHANDTNHIMQGSKANMTSNVAGLKI